MTRGSAVAVAACLATICGHTSSRCVGCSGRKLLRSLYSCSLWSCTIKMYVGFSRDGASSPLYLGTGVSPSHTSSRTIACLGHVDSFASSCFYWQASLLGSHLTIICAVPFPGCPCWRIEVVCACLLSPRLVCPLTTSMCTRSMRHLPVRRHTVSRS